MATKESIVKAPGSRVRRTPIGRRNVLSVTGKEAGYEYRFVNDTNGRPQQFLDNGWELVEQDTVKIGDKRIGSASPSEGTAAVAAVGQGIKAFLMRIRKDWYDEDQATKQAAIDAQEAATKDKAISSGDYGDIKITRS